MHSVRQMNHPERNSALAGRLREFRAQFEALSEPDLAVLADDLVAYADRMGAPLDAAAKRDMRHYLDTHRDALITLGSFMTFTAGLSFGAGTLERLRAGDLSYLLVNIGGWMFPLQQVFAVGSDPSLRGMVERLTRGVGKRAAGDEQAVPKLHAPALQALAKQAASLGDYVFTHRQQVIAEWIFMAEALVTAGWAHVALTGDPSATVSAVAGVTAVGAHAVTTAQNYHRNYLSGPTAQAEPTRLGLPNQRLAASLARQVVGRLPESWHAALPGISLAATQVMMAPAFLRGLEQGNHMEAAGAAGIMLGLGVLYSGFIMPRVPQVLSREDAGRFREQCTLFLRSYFEVQAAKPSPASAIEELKLMKDFTGKLTFLHPTDRKALARDIQQLYSAAHPDTVEPRKAFPFGR